VFLMARRTMWLLALLALSSSSLAPSIQRPAARPPSQAPATPPPRAKRGGIDDGPAVLGADEVPQEQGAPGDLPPLARRLEQSVPGFDLDSVGRSRTELCGFAAGGDGFSLLLSDERDGNRGFHVQKLDRHLVAASELLRVDDRASGKGETEAEIAASATGALGAVWLDVADQSGALRGRAWSKAGRAGSSWSMPLPVDTRPQATPGAATPSVGLEPALIWNDTGSLTVAWHVAGHILLRDVDPSTGATRRESLLGRRNKLAASGPLLAQSKGAIACALDAAGTVMLFLRQGDDAGNTIEVGPGKAFGLAADPNDPDAGWWILMRSRGLLILRHLAHGGAADREDLDLAQQGWRSASLAVGQAGPCILLQYAQGGLGAVWVGPELPTPVVTKTELCAADRSVIVSRHAAQGEEWAFVWSERRGAQVEVNGRGCSRDGKHLQPERRLLEGDGSAVQFQPAAAFAGDRGLVAWTDQRFGGLAVGARGFTAGRKLGSAELFLPADSGTSSSEALQLEVRDRPVAKRPAVAVQASGRALVAWLGAGASGPALFAQRIDVDADAGLQATSQPVEIDPQAAAISTNFPPAVVALRSERGFALAWIRPAPEVGARSEAPSEDGRSEVRLARVNALGVQEGSARTVASGPRLSRPALAQLDDGRIVVAWDSQPEVGARRLAARVFSEVLEPELRELSFETMWRQSDWAPAIAPAAGGFALAWTSGESEESDVFSRLFDSEGRPLSRPLALSTRSGEQKSPSLSRSADGGFIALWQDSLSRQPRFVGRRISAKGAQAGRAVRFSFGSEAPATSLSSPRVIALDGGRLLVVGEHASPGKGFEIGLCFVGPGWDEVEGR